MLTVALTLPSLSATIIAVVTLTILGVGYAILEKNVTIRDPFDSLIKLLIVITVLLWLFYFFGIWTPGSK